MSYSTKKEHKDLVELMISKGATNWNGGLLGACQGGHLNLAKLMISKGANNWNGGVRYACEEGHLNMVELMMYEGDVNMHFGEDSARFGRHKELIDFFRRLNSLRPSTLKSRSKYKKQRLT